MTTELALSAVFSSPALHAIGGLFSDAVLAIAPMVAALGDVVALMEIGQSVAIFFGLLVMIYGAATLTYTRAALGRAKPYPGIRSATATLRTSPRRAGAVAELRNSTADARMCCVGFDSNRSPASATGGSPIAPVALGFAAFAPERARSES